jgi:hypothetical protein
MTNHIIKFIRLISSSIYEITHVDISQWDVESLNQKEVKHDELRRQK